MLCTIDWTDSSPNIRKEHFQKVNNANLLQSLEYGRVVAALDAQVVLWGIIQINGEEAGIVQVLEKTALGYLLQVLILDRGPLWLDGFGTEEHLDAFLKTFRQQYPKRLGRAVRIMPEYEQSDTIDAVMGRHKFKKKTGGYQTYLLDLNRSEEQLRKSLKKNWRSSLSKAEKTGAIVEWDTKGQHLNWLIKMYNFDKKTKGYEGPCVKLINALSKEFIINGNLMIGRVMLENQAIAAILIFCHGRSATYQIGWNTQKGRENGAHNLALWNAAITLKSKDFTTFDLGGVNDTDAQNIKKFKQGMGGNFVTLAGLYT